MILYDCRLTFHDTLFYETRTMGRLYETGRLLHNIALSYALGFAQTSYYHAVDVPDYATEFVPVNEAGVYITPARGDNIHYVIHTFKLGDERTAVRMERSNANIPTYGRAKEIGIGSQFRFGVLSEHPLVFPHWVRMGLWLSKARLEIIERVDLRLIQERRRNTVDLYPLNPLDLPTTATLHLYDLISMRPSSLVENALIEADIWWIGTFADGRTHALPAQMRHQVG
ncbi:MAG: type I-D CRISPR-associated protein Cas5/Csc1 [Anaerolineae bacterium]|nr:type I-D CRISPR-associated protein Cas5/Csc1 [Anaerolineae bacterium]